MPLSTRQPRKKAMKMLRRVLSFVLLAATISGVSACSSPTAWDDDCGDLPGSNTRCD